MKRIAPVLAGLLIALLLLAGCGGVPQGDVDKQIAAAVKDCNDAAGKTLAEKEAAWESESEGLNQQIAEFNAQLASQLRDPTSAGAVAFINADKTDAEIKDDNALAAILVIENAAKQGIKGYWVVARLLGTGFGYNFVGFHIQEPDREWIYFRPTGNQEVKLEVGEKLYQPNQWGAAGFDDTIVSLHCLPIP